MTENDSHICLGLCELAVFHDEVRDLVDDGVVAVVFVGVAGEG